METAPRTLSIALAGVGFAACGLRTSMDEPTLGGTNRPPAGPVNGDNWQDAGATQDLIRIKNGMIGDWSGTVTVPWSSPYQVTFTFDSYTHYSAWASSTSFSAGTAPNRLSRLRS